MSSKSKVKKQNPNFHTEFAKNAKKILNKTVDHKKVDSFFLNILY